MDRVGVKLEKFGHAESLPDNAAKGNNIGNTNRHGRYLDAQSGTR
jgi:hypothetical protein